MDYDVGNTLMTALSYSPFFNHELSLATLVLKSSCLETRTIATNVTEEEHYLYAATSLILYFWNCV